MDTFYAILRVRATRRSVLARDTLVLAFGIVFNCSQCSHLPSALYRNCRKFREHSAFVCLVCVCVVFRDSSTCVCTCVVCCFLETRLSSLDSIAPAKSLLLSRDVQNVQNKRIISDDRTDQREKWSNTVKIRAS